MLLQDSSAITGTESKEDTTIVREDRPGASITIAFSEHPSLDEMLVENPDTIGWIQIADTSINYPVVQGTDNDYYLHNDFYGNASIGAAIFLDYLAEPDTVRNYVLYGHYMSNDTMFGPLWGYQDESFFETHKLITFDTLDEFDGKGTWEVFSVYITEADYNYRQTSFSGDDEFYDYVTRLKDRSLYDTGVELSPDDTILTLSTCIYTFDDARLAVHARKIN
jgi:sortase B